MGGTRGERKKYGKWTFLAEHQAEVVGYGMHYYTN